MGYTESAPIENIDQYLNLLHDKAYGLPFSSAYLNAVTKGQQCGKLYVISAASGVGKTRNLIGNLCHSFAPKYYKNGKWIENVSGTENKALYIGTEMNINEEIVPIILAYLSDVSEDNILNDNLTEVELKRVKEAVNIYNMGNIKLIDFPEYTLSDLKTKITEAVNKDGITHVYFDYIHTTAALLAEFSQNAGKGYSLREDQVLLEVSKMLKSLAKKLNICIVTCTQITGDADKESNRNASLIRGAKSIIDKADVGMIYSRPTQEELSAYESLREKLSIRKPNLVLNIYKNRAGLNQVKILLDVDYSTMRVHDLIIFDINNNPIPLDMLYIKNKDNKLVASSNK